MLDMDPSDASRQTPVMLGHQLIATGNATVNHRLGVIDVLVINVRVRLNIFKASSQPVLENESKCFFADVKDKMSE